MSSSICQGVQTFFDPLLVQPRVLDLAPFPSPAGTGFPRIQDLRGIVCPVTCQDVGAYVHPLIRRSASVLSSKKSLDMCTESLGSETGSDDFLGEDDEADKSQTKPTTGCESRELKCRKSDRSRPYDFPPPLKSMSGSSLVWIRPCCGNGRLVLQAVGVSSCHDSFLIERGGGRLRLSIYRERETVEGNGEEDGEGREVEDEDEDEEEEEKVGRGRWPRRCKEEKGLMNWKARWVAT